MALIVDYNELESLGKSINTSTNDWFGSLESISNAIQTLSGSSNIQGQAADNVKSYLNTVHSSIIAAFGSIMSAHAQNYLLYKREYQSDIDSALHARILQDEILRIQENVQKNKDSTQDVDITIKNAIADISDIIHLGFPGSGVVEGIEEDIIKDITELDNNIVAVENRHYRSDFTETTQLLDALEQLLHQQLGTQRHYKSNFSIDSLGSNKAFLDFAGALSTLAQVQEGKSDAVERAYAEEEQWQERLYEERQREAETINWLVTGLCIVGSVVAIAATGGAATPLVVATISGISGAVSAGTQSLTSQYVETGDWGDTNWAEVGKDAFIGGLAGFATGYIGTAGSQAITSSLSKVQPVSQLLNSSSTTTRVVSNFAIGAGTETVTGMGSRFASTWISSNGDIGAAWNSATDVKRILFDVGVGGASGAIRGIKDPKTIAEDTVRKVELQRGETPAEELIRKVESHEIELETNIQKGNYGEMKMDQYWKDKGYTRISMDEVTDLNAPTHRGIDGVYHNPDGHPPFIIGEAKYGSASLSKLKDGTQQMSNKWILDRLGKTVDSEFAKTIRDEMIINPQNVGTILVKVGKDGSVTETILRNGVIIK